jgi:hypothetical protein
MSLAAKKKKVFVGPYFCLTKLYLTKVRKDGVLQEAKGTLLGST